MTGSSDVIAVKDLRKEYETPRGSVLALEDVAFRVREGEFVAIVGPSGCGKSTLLKILAGLLRATRGEVTLRDVPVTGPRRDIGVVFQSPVLFPWRTVLENVLLPIEVQRLARRLAVHFRDADAIRRSLALTRDSSKPPTERIDAIRDLALAHPPEALQPLEELMVHGASLDIRGEACRALAAYDSAEVPPRILKNWKEYPPALRSEAVNLLAGRKTWAGALLAAVGDKQVPRNRGGLGQSSRHAR